MDEIRAGIAAGNEKFMAAVQRSDGAGIAACYTSDAQVLPPNSAPITGTANIATFFQGMMDMGVKSAKLESQHIEAQGDLAVEVGQYTLTIQPNGMDAMTDVGKYVVVWKNENGVWKLHIDIFNTNAAAQ